MPSYLETQSYVIHYEPLSILIKKHDTQGIVKHISNLDVMVQGCLLDLQLVDHEFHQGQYKTVLEHLIKAQWFKHCSFDNTSILISSRPDLFFKMVEGGLDVFIHNGPKNKIKKANLLHSVCSCEPADISIVQFLLEQGLNINQSDKKREIPLMVALQYSSDIGLIELLLSKGSNVNHQGKQGWNPLFSAILYMPEAIIPLVEHGAHLDVVLNAVKIGVSHSHNVLQYAKRVNMDSYHILQSVFQKKELTKIIMDKNLQPKTSTKPFVV